MNRLTIGLAAVLGIAAAAPGEAGAQGADEIAGPVTPCHNTKAEYRYCRTSNFPYVWSWEISQGAALRDLGSGSNCYRAEVTFTDRAVTLTFRQRNPPTVPQVYDVRKYIQPKACAIPSS